MAETTAQTEHPVLDQVPEDGRAPPTAFRFPVCALHGHEIRSLVAKLQVLPKRELCKQSGKPYLPPRSASLAALTRALATLNPG